MARQSCWYQLQHVFRQTQNSRTQCVEQCVDRCTLPLPVDRSYRNLPIATKCVGEVLTTDNLANGLNLKAMQQVEWNQHFFECRQRSARTNIVFRKPSQCICTHIEQVLELRNCIGTVVPEIAARVCRTNVAGVIIGNITQPGSDRLGHDPVTFAGYVRPIRKILVTVKHGAFVPCANANIVSIVQVDSTAVIETDQRKRIVHDRGAPLRAGRKVVLHANGMSHLVGR